jgi:DNA-binding NtrC family response regulator
LAHALIKKIGQVIGKPNLRISDDAIGLLLARDWPGNVRELENSLTQAMLHARTDLITPELFDSAAAISSGQRGPAPPPAGENARGDLVLTLEEVEADYIQRVLDRTHGHKSRSCAILGISRPALDRKIRKYGLRVPDKQDTP